MNRMQTEAEALGQEPPSYRNVVARLELPEFKTAPAHFRRIFFDTRAGPYVSGLGEVSTSEQVFRPM